MNIFSFLKTSSLYNKTIVKYPNAIVLFSEGNTYKNTNSPLLAELSKHTHIIYLTLDSKDEFLLNPYPNTSSLLVSLDFLGSLFLKKISAKLFITTTPGLGALALKKSKNVKHYSCFMHAPADVHYYQKFSFDCFDSIVACGDFQVKSLLRLEQERNFPVKQKIALGVPYYDIILKEYSEYPTQDQTSHKTILIAPSWGDNNFLNYYQKDLIGTLLKQDYHVILRPHPQSFKHEPMLINSLISKHKTQPNFSIDKNISNIESMKKADLLISGYSGVVFDFIFLTEKPCILFDIKNMGTNFEKQDINFPSWEDNLMPKIGKLVSLEDDIDITAILEEINTNQEAILSNIRTAKSEITNFGDASSKIAEFYLTLLGEIHG